MSAVGEWLPLWLRVALAVVVFVMGSIVLLAAYQAAKVIGAVALEACFNAATHLVDRLTAVFVGWAFGLARRIGQLVRCLLGVLLGAAVTCLLSLRQAYEHRWTRGSRARDGKSSRQNEAPWRASSNARFWSRRMKKARP